MNEQVKPFEQLAQTGEEILVYVVLILAFAVLVKGIVNLHRKQTGQGIQRIITAFVLGAFSSTMFGAFLALIVAFLEMRQLAAEDPFLREYDKADKKSSRPETFAERSLRIGREQRNQ